MVQIELTVQESLEYAQETAYWDGVAAGVQIAASHAKRLALNALEARRSTKKAAPAAHEVVMDSAVKQAVNGKVAEHI